MLTIYKYFWPCWLRGGNSSGLVEPVGEIVVGLV